jgi:hypothetical protein
MRFFQHGLFKTILQFLLIALFFFSVFPFLSLFTGVWIRNYCFKEISYRIIYNKLTDFCEGDSCRAMRIFTFVSENVSVPLQGHPVKDGSPFDILCKGYGYCNQQAHLLITIAAMGEMKGNLIFLRGYDSVSHHSVSELYIGDKYIILDPFYHQIFNTKKNEMAGFRDIAIGDCKPSKNESSLPEEYFQYFEKKFPPQIYITNEVSFQKRIGRVITKAWCNIFEGILVKPYASLYFIVDNSNEAKKNRISRLLLSKN